jgi:hypothetical protein
MAILSIFSNNLKTVSRNWIYFIVLIICPIILIIISGIILNSANFNNIAVGIIDENKNYDIDINSFNHPREFSSLTKCIEQLSLQKVSICMHSHESQEKHNIDVYIDNRKKVIEYYSKQFILEKFSEEKLYFYEQTSKDIEQKISIFSTDIKNSKKELLNAYAELEEQEEKLQEYHQKINQAKKNFNEISASLKRIQPQIKRLKDDLNSETNSVSGNLALIKERRKTIENNMDVLKKYLSTKLSPLDYNYVIGIIDSSIQSLIEIENNMETINQSYSNPEFVKAINDLDSAIGQIDSASKMLEELEIEIINSKENTKNSKEKILYLIQTLNEGEENIKIIAEKLDNKNAYINFMQAFLYSNDPIIASFPFLVSIIITFTAIVLSNMFILKQTSQKSYFREALTPTGDFSFFISAYLTNLFFIFIQIFTLFMIGYVLFGNTLFYNLNILLLTIFLSTSIFIFMGMITGYLIKTQSLSMLLAIFMVIIYFVFSDILAPVALTGPIVKFLVNLNPFVIHNSILFDILLVQSHSEILMEGITKLTIIFCICFILTYVSKKINKRKTLRK